MYDTAIIGGKVVLPDDNIVSATVAIKNGRIAAIINADIPVEANEVVNATNRIVTPGIIESHSHLGIGAGYEDFTTETQAAVRGGVTSVLHFLRHPEPYDATFERTVLEGEARSLIDFGFHIVLLTEEHLSAIPKYIQDFGVTSFKYYMTYRGDDAAMMDFDGSIKRFEGVNDGFLLRCMQEIARYQEAMMLIHAENVEIIQDLRRKFKAEGRQDMAAWQASRPPIAEIEAVRRACYFARNAGARVMFFHVTTGEAVQVIEEYRRSGTKVHAEVCHPYLLVHDSGDLERVYKMKPPFRSKADLEALWRFLGTGIIDTVASDHVPRPLSPKLGELWTNATGVPGTPTLLPALLEEGYHKRNIPLPRLLKSVTATPACLYGLAPRKGSLSIGADADVCLIDIETPRVVRAADLGSIAGYSLYEGMTFRGWPTDVFIRGQRVLQNGRALKQQAGWGRYIRRPVSRSH